MNTINSVTIDLVKTFEDFRAEPYQDQAGVWTIGYGETQGINESTPQITQEQAIHLLTERLGQFGDKVLQIVKTPLNDNQFGAITSLCYNCGFAPLNGTLGRALDRNDIRTASDAFLLWDKIHINGVLTVSQGLLNRRLAEQKLFNSINTTKGVTYD